MTPAQVRRMTPAETSLLIEGWNAAQSAASGNVEPPTLEQFEELVAKYG